MSGSQRFDLRNGRADERTNGRTNGRTRLKL